MSGFSFRNVRYPRYQDTSFLQLCQNKTFCGNAVTKFVDIVNIVVDIFDVDVFLVNDVVVGGGVAFIKIKMDPRINLKHKKDQNMLKWCKQG